MRTIRIQSDGYGAATSVTLEDGTELNPTEADIRIEAGAANEVRLTFERVKVDIHADLHETTLVCPICRDNSTHHCPVAR